MITIIFGPPRIGKTAYMVKKLNDAAFDYERNCAMQSVIRAKNDIEGRNLTIPDHCVAANFEITFKKEFYTPRSARVIDPKRLGFANKEVKTHFILPYETFGIMEAQQYYNSRLFSSFPLWQSNLFEQHGHNNLNFYLDTQRPGLIDINIRELANFIEIRKLDLVCGKYDEIKSMTWTYRAFESSGAVDEYMKSSKKDRTLYTEYKERYDRNVFEQYNSYFCEDRFYEGHENEDFDLAYSAQYLKDITTKGA